MEEHLSSVINKNLNKNIFFLERFSNQILKVCVGIHTENTSRLKISKLIFFTHYVP